MKKGFTLIELLAVIVILAIIALIATPIVLNIINDAKESAVLRSADFYIDALENEIMLENMKQGGSFNPNVCTITNGTVSCDDKVINLKVDGEVPSSGSITFEEGKVTSVNLTYTNGTVTLNNKGELVLGESVEEPICTLINDADNSESITPGDKYQCKVKDNMENDFKDGYYFYVLSTEEDGTTNLIMDQNINSDGTPAGMVGVPQSANATKYNLVAWQSSGYNKNGPVTAMQFLYNATKDWTKVNPINYTYNDREYQGVAADNTEIGYTSFVSTNGIAIITPLTGTATTIGTTDLPLRARMPIYGYKDGTERGEVADQTESNTYLYDNLDLEGNSAPYGYWTLSSRADYSDSAWSVGYDGFVSSDYVDFDGDYGVRAVINLKL